MSSALSKQFLFLSFGVIAFLYRVQGNNVGILGNFTARAVVLKVIYYHVSSKTITSGSVDFVALISITKE